MQGTSDHNYRSIFPVLDRFDGSLFQTYCIFIYFPIGLLLSLVRLCIFFHLIFVSLILRNFGFVRKYVLKVFYLILGFVAIKEDIDEPDCKVSQIFVSNHPTLLDSLAIDNVFPCLWYDSDLGQTFWHYVTNITTFNLTSYEMSNLSEDALLDKSRTFIKNAKLPVLIFPEKRRTKTGKAILKFDQMAFDLDNTVSVLSLKIERPGFFKAIQTGTLESSVISDLFWFFFVPISIFRIKSEKVEKQQNETSAQFCERIRKIMAENLEIPVVDYSFQDWIRQAYLAREKLKQSSSNQDCKVANIKKILPHLHDSVIREELEKSENFDTALNTLLKKYGQNKPVDLGKSDVKIKKMTDFRNFKHYFDEKRREMVHENLQKYLTKNKK